MFIKIRLQLNLQCVVEDFGAKGREEELVLGLAIVFAISALANLAFLISPRTRETILSQGRWLVKRVQAVCAAPNTNSTFPGPRRSEEAIEKSSAQPPSPPPPPPPQQQPAIVWPTVRPSAPPPPPRVLSYGAKGIFETGKKQRFLCLCQSQKFCHVAVSNLT
jgi:hypothetical protein